MILQNNKALGLILSILIFIVGVFIPWDSVFAANSYWDGLSYTGSTATAIDTYNSEEEYILRQHFLVHPVDSYTITEVTLYLSGTCNYAPGVKLSIIGDAVDSGGLSDSVGTNMDWGAGQFQTFIFSTPVEISGENDGDYFRIQPLDCSSQDYHIYGSSVNPYEEPPDIETAVTVRDGINAPRNGIFYFDIPLLNYTPLPPEDVPWCTNCSLWEGFYSEGGGISDGYDRICYTNVVCSFAIDYNTVNAERLIYLFYDLDGLRTVDEAINVISLPAYSPEGVIRKASLIIPNESPNQTISYCIYNESTDEMVCGYDVSWEEEPYYEENASSTNPLSYFDQMFYSDVCEDLSSTTPSGGLSWWPQWLNADSLSSSFWYSVTCGGRKLMHWAIVPTSTSIIKWTEAHDMLKTEFPFSVRYQINSIIASSTSISTTSAFSIDTNSLTSGYLDFGDIVLDASQGLPEVVNQVKDIMVYFLWIVFFYYMVVRIFSLSKKEDDS